MKRIALSLLAVMVVSACYDIYYQPSFENFPDEEDALPYDREIIPADGDTCWFNYHLEKIMVKAVDIEHPTKDLKWEVLIDGNQYGDSKYNNRDGLEVFSIDRLQAVSVMPTVKFTTGYDSVFRYYATLGVGAGMDLSSGVNDTFMALQFTPVGISVGKKIS